MISVTQYQVQLKLRGFDPGRIDGIYGRNTRSALLSFQRQQAIPTTGLPDKATLNALFPNSSTTVADTKQTPVWLQEAERLLGTAEIVGAGSNSKILGWAKKLGGFAARYYNDDAIPWCALFVSHCIGATLPKEPLPSNPLGALNFAKFGRPLTRQSVGAINVFSRKGGGHVGFYLGEDRDAIHLLGGNQSNKVSIARVAKSRLVAVRWPASDSSPEAGPVTLSSSLKLSENEQ